MATATQQAKLQTFNTAYPFDFKLKNNFGDEGLSILYIVNKVDASKSTQSVTLKISQNDNKSYSLRSFQSSTDGHTFDKMPDQNQYNFAFGFRNGVLRKSVLQSFQQNLENAINSTLSDQNNTCIVSPPIPDPVNGTLFFYVAFKNNLSITPGPDGLWGMSIEMEGVSAEPGSGSRATQLEFKCSNLYLNNSGEDLTFERRTHVDIINHQGSGYAPLHFGVLGSGDLLINTPSPLTLYFENIDEKKIDFDDKTKIVFDFTYGDNYVNSFGINTSNDKSGSNLTSISLNYSYTDVQNQMVKKTSTPKSGNKGVVEVVASEWGTGTIPNPIKPDLKTELTTQQGFATKSAKYFAGITSLNDEAKTYVASNVQPLIDLDGKRSDCLNLIKSVNLNYSAYGVGININQPFTVNAWNEAFSKTSQQKVTPDTINQTVLENSSFNTPNQWAPNFLEYVTENFHSLITNLDSFARANGFSQMIGQIKEPIVDRSGNTDSWTTNYFVYPSAALYDYFQIEFRREQELQKLGLVWKTDDITDLYNTLFINVAAPFTTTQWNKTYRFADNHFEDTSELITSAPGVASSFDPLLAWQSSEFSTYVVDNFQSLVKTIQGLTYLSMNGQNYLIPCQSLYDYLWFNFKAGQTNATLNNKEETPDTVPVYLSTEKQVFNFTDVQVTGNPRKVFIKITVEDLPGYFNTTFYVPVDKVNYQLNSDLILPTGRIGIKKTGTFGGTIKTYGNTLIKGSTKIGGYLKVYNYTEIVKNLVVHGNTILDGDTGIGTSNPSEKLHVNGNARIEGAGANETMLSLGGNGDVAIDAPHKPAQRFVVKDDGKVGINQPSPNEQLSVVGNVEIDGKLNVGNTSISTNGNSGSQNELTVNARVKDQTGYIMPVGSIIAYGGSTPPEGWLLCDGSSFDATKYPDLQKALNGTTIPDLRSRFIIGAGQGTKLSNRVFNKPGGYEQITLNESEMPTHTHWYERYDNSTPMEPIPKMALQVGFNQYQNSSGKNETKGAIASAGGNNPHNNMPPYWALTYIIKY